MIVRLDVLRVQIRNAVENRPLAAHAAAARRPRREADSWRDLVRVEAQHHLINVGHMRS